MPPPHSIASLRHRPPLLSSPLLHSSSSLNQQNPNVSSIPCELEEHMTIEQPLLAPFFFPERNLDRRSALGDPAACCRSSSARRALSSRGDPHNAPSEDAAVPTRDAGSPHFRARATRIWAGADRSPLSRCSPALKTLCVQNFQIIRGLLSPVRVVIFPCIELLQKPKKLGEELNSALIPLLGLPSLRSAGEQGEEQYCKQVHQFRTCEEEYLYSSYYGPTGEEASHVLEDVQTSGDVV